MNNVVVNYSEKLTFDEWEKLHKALKEENKTERRFFVKQKLLGAGLVALSVLIPIFLHDITASVLLLPLGIGVIITKDKVVM